MPRPGQEAPPRRQRGSDPLGDMAGAGSRHRHPRWGGHGRRAGSGAGPLPGQPLFSAGGGGLAPAGQAPGAAFGYVPAGGVCPAAGGGGGLWPICLLPGVRGGGRLQRGGRSLPALEGTLPAGCAFGPRGGQPPCRRGDGPRPGDCPRALPRRPPGGGTVPRPGHERRGGQPLPGRGQREASQRQPGLLPAVRVRLCVRRAVRLGLLPVYPGLGGAQRRGQAAVPLPGWGGPAGFVPAALPPGRPPGVRLLVPAGGGQSLRGAVPGGLLPAVFVAPGRGGRSPGQAAAGDGAHAFAAGAVRRLGRLPPNAPDA